MIRITFPSSTKADPEDAVAISRMNPDAFLTFVNSASLASLRQVHVRDKLLTTRHIQLLEAYLSRLLTLGGEGVLTECFAKHITASSPLASAGDTFFECLIHKITSLEWASVFSLSNNLLVMCILRYLMNTGGVLLYELRRKVTEDSFLHCLCVDLEKPPEQQELQNLLFMVIESLDIHSPHYLFLLNHAVSIASSVQPESARVNKIEHLVETVCRHYCFSDSHLECLLNVRALCYAHSLPRLLKKLGPHILHAASKSHILAAGNSESPLHFIKTKSDSGLTPLLLDQVWCFDNFIAYFQDKNEVAQANRAKDTKSSEDEWRRYIQRLDNFVGLYNVIAENYFQTNQQLLQAIKAYLDKSLPTLEGWSLAFVGKSKERYIKLARALEKIPAHTIRRRFNELDQLLREENHHLNHPQSYLFTELKLEARSAQSWLLNSELSRVLGGVLG